MPSRNIFFDARFIRHDHHDGISRFSAGLFEALHARIAVTAIICDKRQLFRLPTGCSYILVNEPTSVRELFVARALNKAGADVVFSPMQTMGSWFRKYKLILTLHDLIYYNHPAPPPDFNFAIKLIWRLFHTVYWPQRVLLNRADAVATVSETSKRLIENHRLTKRRVAVIYNAAGSLLRDYEHKIPAERPRKSQRLVYMGSFMDYKNVETLVEGMNMLSGYELHLLSKISPKRMHELQSLLKPGAGKVVFHNGVSEAEYHAQLDQAVALVTASRDEGFGIPLVESMGRGIPVVVSNIEIFREIGSEAAVFFDQEDPGAFAKAVQSIESNPTWLNLSKKSLRRAADFSWNRSAGDLVDLIAGL